MSSKSIKATYLYFGADGVDHVLQLADAKGFFKDLELLQVVGVRWRLK